MKTKIICIVGPSGSGKTTLALAAEKIVGLRTMVSYTTRPKREDETDGEQHWFVREEEMPPMDEMLAHTHFGGCHYWAAKKDLPQSGAVSYVIDEKGLLNLIEDYSDQYEICSILIRRNEKLLVQAVGQERVNRDKHRVRIDDRSYDAIVENNGTLEEFLCNGIMAINNLIIYGNTGR